VSFTACIGVASGSNLPGHELLKNAGIAMYRAKRQGKNRYVHFEPEMQRAVVTRFELETDLKRAVEHGEFILDYQPVFDLASMSITGAEALLRWKHPTRGIVGPGEFIPYLEESDLIAVVGRWVLDEAIRRAAGWNRDGRQPEISINLSARQLDRDQIVTEIRAALDGTGLDPSSLCVEVTETTLMRDLDEALKRLRAIKALGVRIAIDDFGTGYSSFAHLQQFPFDVLKIDQSFIQRNPSFSVWRTDNQPKCSCIARSNSPKHSISKLWPKALRSRTNWTSYWGRDAAVPRGSYSPGRSAPRRSTYSWDFPVFQCRFRLGPWRGGSRVFAHHLGANVTRMFAQGTETR
jgi:EAL domain-containing protein (putative c-di-GMP-specific phosphodiesterase class I)